MPSLSLSQKKKNKKRLIAGYPAEKETITSTILVGGCLGTVFGDFCR